jgi:uncharacterized membrane protein (UPF0182 family)
LPETIDWPHEPRTRRRRSRRGFFFLIALLAILVLGGRTALSYFVDGLWFRSLGYSQVFWKTLSLQWGIFALFAAITSLILYGSFTALRRVHAGDMPHGHTILVGGQPLTLSIAPVLRVLAVGVSLLIGFISAAAMAAEWPVLALYWYAPQAAGSVTDPIFGKPLNFYLFALPAWHILLNWLLMLAIVPTIVAALFLLVTSGTRAIQDRVAPQADRLIYGNSASRWRSLSVAVAFLLLIAAVREFVGRYDLLFDPHTVFQGITYTDAHVTILGMLVVCVALIAGAMIAATNALRGAGGRWLAAAIVPALLCYLGFALVSWYVGNFVVKPNELVREQPYIAHNIEMTRQAFGLDKFERHEFPAETAPGAADPAANQATLDNIRLWDWHALQDTLRQIQEIRTYYDFPDIDIDRYEINGHKREVMLAARELNVDKLPESSRNWINDKLIYTHGYGITMNPVNGFTPEGLPTLMLSNMPVQSTVPGLNVTRPEIYFGELTDDDVYVKTQQQEFNYPQGQTNSLTSYQGTGGIAVGSLPRRILLAIERGDLGKLPFSDDVNSESRLLMRRNIRERVSALAPFLTFDKDPYIVVGQDGRLRWILDAFTTSDYYPYSSHYRAGDQDVNYLRNSVKAVIDAYDGTTTFYVFDDQDPILAAYRSIFPTLFQEAASMPADLRKHVRYPELLLKLQAQAYGLYHMTNPEVFYNREDLWTVASEVGLSDSGEQTTQAMQPNFVLMKLPGESSEEFVEILPFTPANRNNLIGWIAARSDGPNYGKSVVYDFPKTRLVDGPLQIEARIDQNAQLSGQLTLWNQQGSHVRRGSLLVIPCGKALLYAEPIYLQAERSPMPELRLVVLALQDKLVYGTTFEAALSSLFGDGTSSLTGQEGSPQTAQGSVQGAAQASGQPQVSQDLNGLISEASRDFADYQRFTAEGKLAEAGQKLEQLKAALDKLNTYKK